MPNLENISIILSHPQMGENIGAAARAMKNFNITNMRLVSPRDGWPNQKAIDTSTHAKDIIARAEVFNTLEQAIESFNVIYATTARTRDMNKQEVTAKQAAVEIVNQSAVSKIAILFGAERTGLENSEISHANKIIYIPTSSLYPSLNLSQSVSLVCYEIYQHYVQNEVSATQQAQALKEFEPMADRKSLNALFDFLEAELDANNFFQVAEKKPKMMDNIRSLFTKVELSSQELNTLRGILSSIKSS